MGTVFLRLKLASHLEDQPHPLTSSQVIITCLTFGANLNYLMMLASDYSIVKSCFNNSDEEEFGSERQANSISLEVPFTGCKVRNSVKPFYGATPKRKLLHLSRPSLLCPKCHLTTRRQEWLLLD